ncbi:MAG: DNA-formamidopyrimidine glycosylase [Acidobacteriota bacterium]|nr:DNA-formamidopyrimidine glycosylase [Acidobacteriota bacterium]
MPELPEVETVVRGLVDDLVGTTAVEASISWHKVLGGMSLSEFNETIRGRKITAMFRRGKYICIECSGVYLVIHLRMTGRLYLSDAAEGEDKWVRFTLALDNGKNLAFSDARKFGRVLLTRSLDFLEEKLGPEPLTLKPADFIQILKGSSRAVKVFLLDQKKIAGVGNIYADESLHKAGIKPGRPTNKLRVAEREKLGACIQESLQAAIDHEGASISWYRKPDGGRGESQEHFLVYGRGGEPCYTCGTPITKIVLGQRGTHYCHKCQT